MNHQILHAPVLRLVYVGVLVLFWCVGCATEGKTVDLTSLSKGDPVLSSGYRVGFLYETQVPLLVLGREVGDMSLEKPGGSQPFIENYLNAPARYPYVSRMLPNGSLVEIVRISRDSRSGVINADGKIMDARGDVVSLRGVSAFDYETKYGILAIPDAGYLLPLSSAAKDATWE